MNSKLLLVFVAACLVGMSNNRKVLKFYMNKFSSVPGQGRPITQDDINGSES